MGTEIGGVSLDQDKSDPKVHKETFSVNEAVVKETRQEIPVGIGGVAVQRIPWSDVGATLVASGVTHKRIQAQERCLRPVDVPLEGGKVGKFHCSRPCLAAGLEGGVYCPEHDREAFQPIQDNKPKNQRVFNSASIELTPAERTERWRDEKGVEHTAELQEGRDVAKTRLPYGDGVQIPKIAENTAHKVRKQRTPKTQMVQNAGELRLVFTLDELSSDAVVESFVNKAVAALDSLPASNMAAMKKVVAIQAWLEKIGRAQIVLPEEGK